MSHDSAHVLATHWLRHWPITFEFCLLVLSPLKHSGWWNDSICRGQSGTILRRKLPTCNVPSFCIQSSVRSRSSDAVSTLLVPFIMLLYTTRVVIVWQLNSPFSMEVGWKSQLHRSLTAAARASLTALSMKSPPSWPNRNQKMKKISLAYFIATDMKTVYREGHYSFTILWI